MKLPWQQLPALRNRDCPSSGESTFNFHGNGGKDYQAYRLLIYVAWENRRYAHRHYQLIIGSLTFLTMTRSLQARAPHLFTMMTVKVLLLPDFGSQLYNRNGYLPYL